MKYTQESLRHLHYQYVLDYRRGLLTRSQLRNLIYRLDRISHHVN